MNINEMSIEELYRLKGELVTNFELIQNDIKIINDRLFKLRQEQMLDQQKNQLKVVDNKKTQ